jgi:hypothetical protein
LVEKLIAFVDDIPMEVPAAELNQALIEQTQ